MSKRTLFTALIAVGLALVPSTIPSASAQGPIMYGPGYIDNQWHTVGPNATQWFSFDRPDERVNVTLTLVNGVNLGLIFNVYAPQKPDSPIGRGTSSRVTCKVDDEATKCASSDLTWTGGSGAPGTYRVELINKGSNTTNYLLTLSGGGLTTESVPGYTYYYAPYGVPYTQPYGQPYYVAPYAPSYPQNYLSPYYVPTNAPLYRQYCPRGYIFQNAPNTYGMWFCR